MRAAGTLVFVLVAAAVFAASPLHLPLNNPNEGVRVFAAKALVEQHTFAIDRVVKEWGYIDDKAKHDGKLYSSKAPLMTLLGAAAYAVAHPLTGDLSRPALTRLCRGAGDALPSLIVAFVMWRLLRRRVRDPVVADVVTVGVVLGTGVLASMNVFSGHAFAALAPAAAILLVSEAQAARRHFLAAGLLLAAAVGAEYPAFAACAPLVVVALVLPAEPTRDKRLLWLAIGAAPVILVVALAHTAQFGAPWRTGYSFLENRGYQELVSGTFFGIGAPHVEVLATVLFSVEIGLFFVSPFLLAGLVGVVLLVRERPSRAMGVGLVVGVLLMLLFIAGFKGWRGGWSVGPRYISEVIGLLAWPTALAFDRWSSTRPWLARAVLAALVAVGVVQAGVAGMFFPHLSDVYRDPVFEMMLPVVAKGFSPDSVFLVLGAKPAWSAALLVVVLALPWGAALLLSRDARTFAAGLAFSVVAVALVATLARAARTEPTKAALETRRLLDNWRPEEGNPILVADEDLRALVAVDRARVALPLARRERCGPSLAVTRHALGPPFRELAALTKEDSLVVVPDAWADRLDRAIGPGPLFVTRTDVERNLKSEPFVCGEEMLVVAPPGTSLPRALQSLPVVGREPFLSGELGAFEVTRLGRGP